MKRNRNSEKEAFEFMVVSAGERLSFAHRQTVLEMEESIISFCDYFSVENVGYLELNFKEPVTDMREAARTFEMLNATVLEEHYQAFIRVFERGGCGRINYHLLVALDHEDKRSVEQKASEEREFWRQIGPSYGLGCCKVSPVKSRDEAVGTFACRYILEHGGSEPSLKSNHSGN